MTVYLATKLHQNVHAVVPVPAAVLAFLRVVAAANDGNGHAKLPLHAVPERDACDVGTTKKRLF